MLNCKFIDEVSDLPCYGKSNNHLEVFRDRSDMVILWVVIMFIYVVFILVGTLIALTRSSWFLVWLGLEINMMGFIPFVGVRGGRSISERVFKYFLIQAIGSIFLFVVGIFGGLR